ncbi:MAG: hypothetical protein IKF14_14575 [Atopobiaceae bacterium]|nr:hypothetical protein [Atopobiaceae bacterium]
MITRKQFIAAILSTTTSCLLSACTGGTMSTKKQEAREEAAQQEAAEENGTGTATDEVVDLAGSTLIVATTSDPYTRILEDFAVPAFAEQEITLEIKGCKSADEANEVAKSGKADACFCQQLNELNAYNLENSKGLSYLGGVFYRPYGVYSTKHDTLREIARDETIAIPADVVGKGRALLLLFQEGIIKLNDPNKLDVSTFDIAENPLSIQFREVDASELPQQLEDVDYVIFDPSATIDATEEDAMTESAANEAIANEKGTRELSVADAIVIEASDGLAATQYASVMATASRLKDDARIAALMELLHSSEFSRFLQDTYGQELIPTT